LGGDELDDLQGGGALDLLRVMGAAGEAEGGEVVTRASGGVELLDPATSSEDVFRCGEVPFLRVFSVVSVNTLYLPGGDRRSEEQEAEVDIASTEQGGGCR
jgi:hypothetical protein